jgi:hypothetical protein
MVLSGLTLPSAQYEFCNRSSMHPQSSSIRQRNTSLGSGAQNLHSGGLMCSRRFLLWVSRPFFDQRVVDDRAIGAALELTQRPLEVEDQSDNEAG